MNVICSTKYHRHLCTDSSIKKKTSKVTSRLVPLFQSAKQKKLHLNDFLVAITVIPHLHSTSTVKMITFKKLPQF